MRGTSVWAGLLGLSAALVEHVKASSEGEVAVAVRPTGRSAITRSVVLPAHQGNRRTARRDSKRAGVAPVNRLLQRYPSDPACVKDGNSPTCLRRPGNWRRSSFVSPGSRSGPSFS